MGVISRWVELMKVLIEVVQRHVDANGWAKQKDHRASMINRRRDLGMASVYLNIIGVESVANSSQEAEVGHKVNNN